MSASTEGNFWQSPPHEECLGQGESPPSGLPPRAASDSESGGNPGVMDYQRLIDAAPSGVWAIDLEGRTTFVNARMGELLGYTREEMIGRPHTDFMWEEDRHQGDQDLKARRQGMRSVWDQRYRRKDGSELWTVASCTSLYDEAGRITGALGLFTDINDRKQAERELRDHRRKVGIAMKAARAGLWTWDARSSELTWSAELYGLFGLDDSRPITVEQWDATVHPDDRERVRRFGEDLLSRPQDFRAEYRIVRPDGERWVLVMGEVERDARGQALRYIGMNLDITDRKAAEARIAESEARYRLLADSTPDAFAAFDRDLRYVYWNPAAEAATGRAAGEVLGKTRVEVWGDTQIVRFMDRKLRECMATGESLSFEAPGLVPERVEWEHVRLVPMPDGVASFSRDITRQRATSKERRELFAQVRDEKARLALVLENITEEVWFHDADGRVVLQNRAARAAFGPVAERDLQALAASVEIRRPDGTRRPMNENPFARALAGEEVRDVEEIVQLPVNGEWRTRHVTSVPARGSAGEVIGVVSVVRDVTEEKRVNEELRATEAALREADRRKDVFLATLAHELRNPLAPIRTIAEILDSPDLERSGLESVQVILKRQATHMARLLDDLLDVSRITQGKLTLQRAWIPLAPVVEAAVEAARPTLEEKKHHLTISLPAEPILLEADSVRLSQVMSNLLTNAAKYTDTGGEITLSAHVSHGTLSLSVKDTGIGIPPPSLARIFDMFEQVDAESPRTGGGLGIGLALVKGIVELHGGTIEAKSVGLGHGSEFCLSLPIPEDIPMRRSDDSTASRRRASPRRIVLADDNEDAADSLAILLELRGHEVRVAYSGKAALDLVRDFKPDVAILDIGMPDPNGYAVATALRRDFPRADLFLIALTGWGQDVDKQRARVAGFDAHLTKPTDEMAIDSLLQSTETRRGPERI